MVCKLTKNYLFWLIKYPCYSYKHLIKRKAALVDVSRSDFEEYTRTSTKIDTTRWHTFWALVCLIFAIKNLSVPYLIAHNLDFKSPYANGSNAWLISDNVYQVVCLQTNCTQFLLPGTGNTLDLRQFPVIPVCYPNYNKLFLPTTFLGPFSMILHAMFGFSVLVFGVVLPLSQLRSPLKCDPLMFVIAPELTKEFIILRAKEIYNDLKISWVNFVDVNKEKLLFRKLALTGSRTEQRMSIQLEIKSFRNAHRHRLSNYSASVSGGLLAINYNDSDGYSYKTGYGNGHETSNFEDNDNGGGGGYADDDDDDDDDGYSKEDEDDADDCSTMQFLVHCLPFVRTMWWRSKAEALFVRILIIGILLLMVQGATTSFDVFERLVLRMREVEAMRESVAQTGCKEWFPAEHNESARVFVDLFGLQISWNPFAIIDHLLLSMLLIIGPCVVANAYLIYSELTCWRLELDNELQILNEITRLRCVGDERRRSSTDDERQLIGGLSIDPTASSSDLKQQKGLVSEQQLANDSCKYNSTHIYGKIRHQFFKNNVLGRLAFKTAPFQRTDAIADGTKHKGTCLNSKIGIQQLVIGFMTDEEVSLDTYIKLMEKTYISFRLFMEHVEHCSRTSPPLTFVSHMLYYGTIVVSVWHSRLLQQFNYEHMVIIAISCLSSLTMITLMSDFHAKVSVPCCAQGARQNDFRRSTNFCERRLCRPPKPITT